MTDGYWFTVGGGLEPGESQADAAVREVVEETGLRITPAALVGPVRSDVVQFPFDGRWYAQEQCFFVLRAAAAFDADLTHLDDDEVRSVDGTRWWSVTELEHTAERFYPGDLVPLLREVA